MAYGTQPHTYLFAAKNAHTTQSKGRPIPTPTRPPPSAVEAAPAASSSDLVGGSKLVPPVSTDACTRGSEKDRTSTTRSAGVAFCRALIPPSVETGTSATSQGLAVSHPFDSVPPPHAWVIL